MDINNKQTQFRQKTYHQELIINGFSDNIGKLTLNGSTVTTWPTSATSFTKWGNIVGGNIDYQLDLKDKLDGKTNLTDFNILTSNVSTLSSNVITLSTEVNTMSGNIITLSGANYVPAGAIMPFAMATAPVGWISCDGSSLSRTTYNTLFLAIGTTWGNVDINTFNVPNLNGKTLVQYDASQTEFNAIAKTGGENTHTLGVTEIPSHNHGGAASGSFSGTTDSGGAGGDNVSSNTKRGTSAGSSFNSSEIATTGDSHTHSYSGSVSVGIASQGGSVAHNNLQPYAVIKYCIKT